MDFVDFGGALQNDFFAQIVFARSDKTAVYQSVGGYHGGIGLFDVFSCPFSQFVGAAFGVSAVAEVFFRRRQHFIAEIAYIIGRLLEGNGTVVMGNE